MLSFEVMKRAGAKAIVNAVTAWAIERDDIRAMALAGSWARDASRQDSDVDVVILTDRAADYRRRRTWLTEIDFAGAGYRIQSSASAVYGVVWSRHIRLLPTAEVELTFAHCSWARTDPIDRGTRRVVSDALRIVFDKDGRLAKLVAAVMSPSGRSP